LEDFSMNRTRWFRRRPGRRLPPFRARPQVEQLEVRNLLSTNMGLTPLVPVSDPSPLSPPSSTSPPVFPNSEVEPQLAVDHRPGYSDHAVAIWQQDRYRSVGGARALVVSVTQNASANDRTHMTGATWSTPTAIPYFDATNPLGSAFDRYTDPWVTI